MKTAALAFALTGLLAAGQAYANEKLVSSSGCMTCHATDRKNIGPSFKDIAAKYRNDKGAEALLVKKIRSGGSGVWGSVPMPPSAHVKEEDARAIVQWILAIK